MSIKSIKDIIYWDSRLFDSWNTFRFQTLEDSANFLRSKRLELTFNIMSSFENIPLTLPSTNNILNGEYNENISTRDYLRVRVFAKIIDLVSAAILKNIFNFNLKSIKAIHKNVSQYDLPQNDRGIFRKYPVKLGNIKYQPPSFVMLKNIWVDGGEKINSLKNNLEKSIILFLWMSRTQFFGDCNKRTALLASISFQTLNKIPCLLLPNNDCKNFSAEMRHFYETGNTNRIIKLFEEYHQDTIHNINQHKRDLICQENNMAQLSPK